MSQANQTEVHEIVAELKAIIIEALQILGDEDESYNIMSLKQETASNAVPNPVTKKRTSSRAAHLTVTKKRGC
jgi:hypothetical protein